MCHQRVVASLVWGDDARGDHRQYPFALGRGPGAQQRAEVQALHRASNRLHVAVGARGSDLERLRNGLHVLAGEHGADCCDLRTGEARQVGERSFAHLRSLAIGLAQQHGGRRAAVGDDVDVHVYLVQYFYC